MPLWPISYELSIFPQVAQPRSYQNTRSGTFSIALFNRNPTAVVEFVRIHIICIAILHPYRIENVAKNIVKIENYSKKFIVKSYSKNLELCYNL